MGSEFVCDDAALRDAVAVIGALGRTVAQKLPRAHHFGSQPGFVRLTLAPAFAQGLASLSQPYLQVT